MPYFKKAKLLRAVYVLVLLIPLGAPAELAPPPDPFGLNLNVRASEVQGINNMRGRNRTLYDDGLFENDAFSLKPYSWAKGNVFDEDGRPAADIAVRLTRIQEPSYTYEARTTRSGEYLRDGMPPGHYRIAVLYKGKAGLLREVYFSIGHSVTNDFDLKEFTPMGEPGEYEKRLAAQRVNREKAEYEAMRLTAGARLMYDLAELHLLERDTQSAIGYLKQLDEKNQPHLWRQVGERLAEAKQYDEAIKAFTRAAELRPELADYPGLIALCLLRLNRIEDGVSFTEKTARIDRLAGGIAYYNLGVALLGAHRIREAEPAFKRSFELYEASGVTR
jgi:tetratricopeptide (TPR) repeat protein